MASTTSPESIGPASHARQGFIAGFGAYVLWGFLPLALFYLKDVDALTVIADRTLWALLVVGVIIVARRRMPETIQAFRDWAMLKRMLLTAVLLAGNWLTFLYAVNTGQTLEGSFGYFINPLVSVAIGMVFLGERLNRWQALAIVIALVALVIQAIGIGRVPYIAITLALSFGFYGFVRKTTKVRSTSGLFIETALLAPIAVGYLLFTFVRDGGIGPHGDPTHLALLALTGPLTAMPLLLFAFAVQRLRLTTMGMLQYVGPSIQFVLAITMLGETLNAERLVSFGLIWLSLGVYTADSYFRRRATPVTPT